MSIDFNDFTFDISVYFGYNFRFAVVFYIYKNK